MTSGSAFVAFTGVGYRLGGTPSQDSGDPPIVVESGDEELDPATLNEHALGDLTDWAALSYATASWMNSTLETFPAVESTQSFRDDVLEYCAEATRFSTHLDAIITRYFDDGSLNVHAELRNATFTRDKLQVVWEQLERDLDNMEARWGSRDRERPAPLPFHLRWGRRPWKRQKKNH